MQLLKWLLLKPALNLLNRILKIEGRNSLIIGGPLGWSWQATLDVAHHGSLAGPANAHRHSDLASIGIDDHHARDHAVRHQADGPDEINIGGLNGEPVTLASHKNLATGVHGVGDSFIESTSGSQAKVDVHASTTIVHAEATNLEKTANKGAANGYASLDSTARVPTAQLGAGTADSSKFLRGDRVWAVVEGGGGAAPSDDPIIWSMIL